MTAMLVFDVSMHVALVGYVGEVSFSLALVSDSGAVLGGGNIEQILPHPYAHELEGRKFTGSGVVRARFPMSFLQGLESLSPRIHISGDVSYLDDSGNENADVLSNAQSNGGDINIRFLEAGLIFLNRPHKKAWCYWVAPPLCSQDVQNYSQQPSHKMVCKLAASLVQRLRW
ncbi:hypothetical protein [Vibrio sp. 10N.261.51.F12]|uniref:hypothetical protein n=1 Tax=Vibrio sp. 10N.261.51.F12 TaxID=3229679 RepID=UPI003556A71A